MKRVLDLLPKSTELACIDSTGNVDSNNCRMFHIMADTPMGGLPVGAIITTSEETDVLVPAFNAWRSLLSPNAFNGSSSPKVIITDDCTGLRNALAIVFPTAVI